MRIEETIIEAVKMCKGFINHDTKGIWHDRTVEQARKYKALITGENCDWLLKQFVRREDTEAFEQRVALTISITPAVCGTLMNPYSKVLRNENVKKSFSFGDTALDSRVETMRKAFYGRKRGKNKGFDYWIKTRFPILSFTDPNSWVVTEWDAPESQSQIIQPRPFEVSSENALNFHIYNEEVKWLFAYQDILVERYKKAKAVKGGSVTEEVEYFEGKKFTLYGIGYTIVLREVDKVHFTNSDAVLEENQQMWDADKGARTFVISTYKTNLDYVPVFRVGYIFDPETNCETCVNGFHKAMPFLMKSVKSVSEMDLSVSLHTFPQKMQYVSRCPGVDSKNRCIEGYTIGGGKCSVCKGSGIAVHTSAQDALYFPMPDKNTPNNEVLDLDKMLAYKYPPIELLKFQDSYIKGLENSCMTAVFGGGQSVKTSAPNVNGVENPKTATEVNMNMQGVYDALMPFVEKISEVWVDSIYTFARLGGLAETVDESDYEIICVYPDDLKLKGIAELLADLKTANESGAPAMLIAQINDDIAALLYNGDDIAQKMYDVKKRFYPFNGLSADSLAMALGSQYVTKYAKVLASNFEAIFSDIESEHPDFYFMNPVQQETIVSEMVAAYIEDIDGDSAIGLNIAAEGMNGGADNTDAGDGNPGDDDEQDSDNGTDSADGTDTTDTTE